MTRTVLTKQQTLNTGITPVYVAGSASLGHSFANTGHEMLHVKNGGVAPVDVTIATTGKLAGLSLAALKVTVTNAQERMIGPFDPTVFNQPDGTVNVDLSGDAGITLGVFAVG
jgi:hypothetical protein